MVTISRPFCIGKYEVTQAEYQAVMGVNPSRYQGAGYPNSARRPVERVRWQEAMNFCATLTALEQARGRVPAGYEYRLPTEAEWEYCCRAGTTTEFNVGTTLDCSQAMFYLTQANVTCWTGNGSTVLVGSYAANAWGLHDMHGNVLEWCLDAWDGVLGYPAGPVTDPFVRDQLHPGRIRRGGAYWGADGRCRSAYRQLDYAGNLADSVGFRVVLAPVIATP